MNGEERLKLKSAGTGFNRFLRTIILLEKGE